MKATRNLLLGTAALVVSVHAQAADLPVKAKPVLYVKICSLYGNGFYYIPGTDTCIKFGGYIRADYHWNASGGGTPTYTGGNGRQTRESNRFATRHRTNLTIDTRTGTPYGVLRTFASVHNQNENEGTNVAAPVRTFIQWAGFTFGRAQSFTDIVWGEQFQFGTPQIGSTNDGDGTNQAAYTWQLGAGTTFTVGVEERRHAALGKSIVNLSTTNAFTVGATAANSSHGTSFPDFLAVLRVQQQWGYFGVFGVGHDASARYYNGPFAGSPCTGGNTGTSLCGHPDSVLGYAVGGGAMLNLPFIASGDRIGAQIAYSKGAGAYVANKHSSAGLFGDGNQVAVGWLTDGVYINGSDVELTEAWSIIGGFEHVWSPVLRTSWFGGYLQVDYNPTATGFFCGAGAVQAAINTLSNCNPDYRLWYVGSRTIWAPVRNFFLGIETMYTRVETAFEGTANLSGIGTRPAGTYRLRDQGITSITFRAQRTWN
jgi:hypothetical protein